jgi:hypothetical protein
MLNTTCRFKIKYKTTYFKYSNHLYPLLYHPNKVKKKIMLTISYLNSTVFAKPPERNQTNMAPALTNVTLK